MPLSFLLLLAGAYLLSRTFEAWKLPGLIGAILWGLLIGPEVLNLLSPWLLGHSATLRQIALVIIVLKAGLKLSFKELKQVGGPALRLSFLPASAEILSYLIFAPLLLGLSWQSAGLMGAVMGAVSPAVVVPRMTSYIEEGRGQERLVPQLMLAAASVDDVFCLLVFSSLVASSGQALLHAIWKFPLALASGSLAGFVAASLLRPLLRRLPRIKLLAMAPFLLVALLLLFVERYLSSYYAGLIAVLVFGMQLKKLDPKAQPKLSKGLDQAWKLASLWLFALLGASVPIKRALLGTPALLLLLCLGLVFRLLASHCSLHKSGLLSREKRFIYLAELPKATVQAAIGGLPLALGLPGGEPILTLAALGILITAPVGALLMDRKVDALLGPPR